MPRGNFLLRTLKHPDRERIVRQNPNITKREAHALMRKLDSAAQEKQAEAQEGEWLKDIRRGFRELYSHAQEACRAAEVWIKCEPEKQRELLEVAESLDNLVMYGKGIVRFGEHFRALREQQSAEEFAQQKAQEAAEQEAQEAEKQESAAPEPEVSAPVKQKRRAKAAEESVHATAA